MSETKLPPGFTPWHGGACPVPPDTFVSVVFSNGYIDIGKPARWWNWACAVTPIIGYRVVEEQRASGQMGYGASVAMADTPLAPGTSATEAHQSAAPQEPEKAHEQKLASDEKGVSDRALASADAAPSHLTCPTGDPCYALGCKVRGCLRMEVCRGFPAPSEPVKTLRDEWALQIHRGIIARFGSNGGPTDAWAVTRAYELADHAMFAARERK